LARKRLDQNALNRLSYAREKLSAAVYVLATNPYDVKVRLYWAWESVSAISWTDHHRHGDTSGCQYRRSQNQETLINQATLPRDFSVTLACS
jgi:hypothetical protein